MRSPAPRAARAVAEPAAAASKCRRRVIPPGASRPSDMLAAFFSAGLAMLALGGACAIADAAGGDWRLHWLALHLALLGGVSQLVLGAAQFFVCAFLATTPPSRRMVAAQIAVWNLGTVLVAVGVTAASPRIAEAGGAVLALGLGLYIAQMGAMQRRSMQTARWAVRWYEASAACLVAGILVGVLLAGGASWTHGSLLGAHLALNIAGWMGTAIVGTLHTFFPSLTGTMLRFPRLQGPTFAAWLAGVALLALGAAFGSDPVVAAGWLGALAAAALLAANVAGSLRSRTIELTDPTKHPLGLWDGSTENATVAATLLANLTGHGLDVDQGVLVVLDGGKALGKAVNDVFGIHTATAPVSFAAASSDHARSIPSAIEAAALLRADLSESRAGILVYPVPGAGRIEQRLPGAGQVPVALRGAHSAVADGVVGRCGSGPSGAGFPSVPPALRSRRVARAYAGRGVTAHRSSSVSPFFPLVSVQPGG